jgi:DNA topoisomerase-2
MGGSDASQPRYIFTLINPVTHSLFKKEDFDVLTYINDDGVMVEPLYYTPILPAILINGSIGIGTGFSCTIPSFNPIDIIDVIKKLMCNVDVDKMELVPWYRGFKGAIEKNKLGKFVSRGIFKKVSATKIDVYELPIGTWIIDFKEHLEDYMDKHPTILKKYDSQASAEEINFSLHFTSSSICDDFMKVDDNGYTKFENEMKLVSAKGLSVSNMHLFNSKCQITKYDTVVHIIEEFYHVRLEFYEKRREALLKQLKYDNEIRKNKIRFIKEVVAEKISVHKMRKEQLEAKLVEDEYMLHEDKYDYILRIPVYNLTIDKVEEIENEKVKADVEIDKITALHVVDWWKEDLQKFEMEYKKYLDSHNKSESKTKSKK